MGNWLSEMSKDLLCKGKIISQKARTMIKKTEENNIKKELGSLNTLL